MAKDNRAHKMKYIVLIGDGMAGRPLKRLGYKTCLQKARTPNMDKLAANGEIGKVKTIPSGFEPGSDVANLSILGYDPKKYYSGRAPIEAQYRGVKLNTRDIAFRCNLVTLKLSESGLRKSAVMQDYSAGHITTKEARRIISDINRELGNYDISFHPGVSYRHLMVWKNGKERIRCTPPHDITGKKIGNYLPKGKGNEFLNTMMEKSTDILLSHPVNINRKKNGLSPANSLWFWGQGKKISMPSFKDKYNIKGALISAVDLTKGLGISAGFDILHVKGATGYIDTNYIGKARAAVGALKKYDIVYVHVEAPDEAGHKGDVKVKIQAIEDFDSKVVGTIISSIEKFKNCSILLLPDHATPISVKTHTNEPVPFVVFRSNESAVGRKTSLYSENICRMKNVKTFEKGHKLMDYFIKYK
jgi:2,3-bisphosphoglycerate-independent phosphoglycerate mutase